MEEDIFLKNWKHFKTKIPHRFEPYSKRNWGSSLHSLCSYQGKMKPSLVHHLISLLSNKNNIVLDPFSGSGTVLLESAINNRNSIGFDISTIGTCISKAKVSNFNKKKIKKIIIDLKNYLKNNKPTKKTLKDAKEVCFNKNIKDYFEKNTYLEVLLARDFFIKNLDITSADWCLVFSCMLHILHGNRPYALSRRSHPLTPYAPTGPYIKKSVIRLLENKVDKSIKANRGDDFKTGKVFQADVMKKWKIKDGSIDFILTSPPFAKSTKFYMSNWMRFWFAGWSKLDFDKKSINYVEKKQLKDFSIYHHIFEEAFRVLKNNKFVIFHLGLNSKFNMGKELIPIGKKYFKFIDLFDETVEHCETHGIKDKGDTTQHQYLVLQKLH